MKNLILITTISLLLSGCAAVAVGGATYGAGASGIFDPSEETLQQITARNFGVDKAKVKISNISKENGGIYYDASINGKPQKCMVTSSFGHTSSPLCAKPGQPLTGGTALTGGK